MNGRETLEEKARLGRGRAHTVELTNRESAVFAGVADVEAFNEEGLHIVKLNLDEGVLAVEGRVSALEYVQDEKPAKKGLFSGLFK